MRSTDPPAHRPLRRWGYPVGFLALGVWFWLTAVRPPQFDPPQPDGTHPSHGLTASWEQALAYFLKHRALAGTDYVFTYGPLGYLGCLTYDPDLYWLKYGWELTVSALMAVVLVLIVRRLPDLPTRLLCCYLVLAYDIDFADGRYAFLLLACGLFLLEPGRRFWRLIGPALLAFAVIALIKFTFSILAGIGVLVVAARHLADRRPAMAGATALGFAAALLTAWLAAGQTFGNLPACIRAAYEIVAGYGPAMCVPGPWPEVALGVILLALLAGLGAVLGDGSVPRFQVLAAGLVLVAGVFVQWKLGFTRGDHPRVFFITMLLVPFVLTACVPPPPRGRTTRWMLTVGAVLASLVGAHWSRDPQLGLDLDLPGTLSEAGSRLVEHTAYVFAPRALEARLQHLWERDRHEQPLLPQTEAVVGKAAVDLFSWHQGIVFSQGMNWRPRPVFQSYSAYTPYLLDLNARFFRSERAPEYLIFSSLALDRRFYALEDSQALLEIFPRYSPVLIEHGCVLLKRKAQAPGTTPERTTVLDRAVRMGERVDLGGLPGSEQTLAVHIDYTMWGRLLALAYQPPTVWLRLEFAEGELELRRLVVATAMEDFLLKPFLDSPLDLPTVYGLGRPRSVKALQVVVMGNPACYRDTVRLVIKSVQDLAGPRATAERQR